MRKWRWKNIYLEIVLSVNICKPNDFDKTIKHKIQKAKDDGETMERMNEIFEIK